jgi:D-alanyl-D-alanine carboxypeptidase
MPHSAAPVVKPKPPRVVAAAVRRGNSPAVVQLGAYGSPSRVLTAWNGAAQKYGVLKGYLPMSARFASPKGTFYRLSVKGFASDREARLTCEALHRQGASCFVRNFAGDTPVQYASR